MLATLCLLAGAGAAGPALASGLPSLQLGFGDGLYTASDSAVRATWLERSAALGARVVRMYAGWPAATRPADPADPADPAYAFTSLDAAIRDAAAHHLAPLLVFSGAPSWAEGPSRPASATPGTWLPDPAAVGAYGRALATRYDGHFPDPLHPGLALPRVKLFQLWNEPNLSAYLTPQWQRRAGRWIPVAADQYRLMLNAFYAGVNATVAGDTVVAAGTAPYGDFGHGQRMMPVVFWKNLLASPVSFDVMAHQPYSIGSPPTKALDAGDVAVADLGKLTSVLRAAERRGTALPRGEHHQLWITETGYDTRPPNPGGVPVATDARWLEQSLFLFWAQGVDLVTWYLIRDQPPGGPPDSSSQTGVYYYAGNPKPAATAYRFPLVGHRVAGGKVRAWLRAPQAGTLVLQARSSGRWATVRRTVVSAAQILDLPVPGRPQELRATVAGISSLVWTL
ncbi:MAG TPA: hypothetical protein VG165_12420 [Solirubrobacteraceae bacterium]|nr:hypothetical protein [Solirubrobacteraceae bacterium]